MASFLGKSVVVTGASSGIGFEAAVKFATLGANLTLVGRNEQKLAEVASKCLIAKDKGQREPLIIRAELSREDETGNIIKKAVDHFGQLDVLVNNAGMLEAGTIENTSLEQYDRVMNVNVRSVYQLTMLAVPHLKKTQGNIVNVSSVNGTRSFPGVLAYNISKAAVNQLTSCTALELAPYNVRVNSVNPGVIITNIHKRGGMTDDAYKAFLNRAKETHALGRPGNVSEVAEAITFLASDSASFTTGQHLHVDGGRHAMCPR